MKEASLFGLSELFILQEVFDVIIMNNLFLEAVGTCKRRLNHFYYFGKLFSFTGFQGCNYFLCHD
jgi:hypothetical protein